MRNEEWTFEKITIALGMAAFNFWFYPTVMIDIWDAQLVPLGAAPAPGFWWMFWAMVFLTAMFGSRSANGHSFAELIAAAIWKNLIVATFWLACT